MTQNGNKLRKVLKSYSVLTGKYHWANTAKNHVFASFFPVTNNNLPIEVIPNLAVSQNL